MKQLIIFFVFFACLFNLFTLTSSANYNGCQTCSKCKWSNHNLFSKIWQLNYFKSISGQCLATGGCNLLCGKWTCEYFFVLILFSKTLLNYLKTISGSCPGISPECSYCSCTSTVNEGGGWTRGHNCNCRCP